VFQRVGKGILKNLTDANPDMVRVRNILEKLDIEIPKAA